ncbi:hypothetical protein BJX64DRAFT_265579 [Aspergillus heterothallicus]
MVLLLLGHRVLLGCCGAFSAYGVAGAGTGYADEETVLCVLGSPPPTKPATATARSRGAELPPPKFTPAANLIAWYGGRSEISHFDGYDLLRSYY